MKQEEFKGDILCLIFLNPSCKANAYSYVTHDIGVNTVTLLLSSGTYTPLFCTTGTSFNRVADFSVIKY